MLKFNANGTLEIRKSRVVATGYTQKAGLDYNETSSPVAKMATVKLLLKISASKQWFLHQLDISNAFLNGELYEEIYMRLLEGYEERLKEVPTNSVCKLKKSIYALKQASHQWFKKFSTSLLMLGFQKAHGDQTLFVRQIAEDFVVVLVYVNDIIIASTNADVSTKLTSDLKGFFKLRDLGSLKYFLGLEISRTADGIFLCQRKYALELLTSTGMLECKPSSVLMTPNLKLSKEHGDMIEDRGIYRRLVGRLMYLTTTRPDITFAVNKLCQFSSAPRTSHFGAVYKVEQLSLCTRWFVRSRLCL